MSVPAGILEQFRAAISQGKHAQARLHAERALALTPDSPVAHDMLRSAMVGQGQFAEALPHAERVTQLLSDHAGGWASLGLTLALMGRKAECVEPFKRAADLEPHEISHQIELATAYINAGRLAEAEDLCRAALIRFGTRDEFLFRLMATLTEQARADEAAEALARGLFERPLSEPIAASLCCTSLYCGGLPPKTVIEHHRNFGRIVAPQNPAELFRHERPRPGAAPAGLTMPGRGSGGRVRVAFVSSDLRGHSVARFAEPAIARLDRARFEPLCVATLPGEDKFTARLRTALAGGQWIKGWGLPPRALGEALVRNRADVVIDLNGLTQGGVWNTLALKPAPVQITYCGYPHTTGLAAVDWRIVDAITDPPGAADAACVEKLIRLDPCFLCYQPPDAEDAGEPRTPVDDARRAIVFGSFNRLVKVSDLCLRAWAAILTRVPTARLVIKSATLIDPLVAERFTRRVAGLGIDPSRVEVRTKTVSLRDHMDQYRGIDIALDTFPYAGTTTTCEALYMGVPVVTLARPFEQSGHAERVGKSLLTAAGMAELAAESIDGYIDLAASLAADRVRLAAMQRDARDKLLASPLCDQRAFGRAFSNAVAGAWNAWCAKP